MKFGRHEAAAGGADQFDSYRGLLDRIIADGVGDSEALGLVTDEDRLSLARTVVSDLPPSAQLQLHGNVPIEEVIAAQEETEKRNGVMADIITHGHDTSTIDFDIVPTDTTLRIDLHDLDKGQEPKRRNREVTLELSSLGDGVYHNVRRPIKGHEYYVGQDQAILLRRIDPKTKELTPIGKFGRRLGFLFGTTHYGRRTSEYVAFRYRQPLDGPIVNLSLGHVMLDGQTVFSRS